MKSEWQIQKLLYDCEYFSLASNHSTHFLKNKNFSYPSFSFCWPFICYLKMHSQSIKIGQRRGEAPPCLSSPSPLQLILGPTSSTKPFSLPQSPTETFSPLPGAFVVRCHFWALNPLLFNTLLVQQPTFSSVVHWYPVLSGWARSLC